MSRALGYDKPVDQDDIYNDHDSDIDLQLDELDPQTSTSRPSNQRQFSISRLSSDFGSRIPLRNLRFGGRRRPQQDDARELEEAIEEDEGFRKRQSAAS